MRKVTLNSWPRVTATGAENPTIRPEVVEKREMAERNVATLKRMVDVCKGGRESSV